METIPEKLYKFRDWEVCKHKRMITHNEVFFTSPKAFNDPFDCAIPINYDGIFDAEDNQLLDFFRFFFNQEHPDLNDEDILKIAKTEYLPKMKDNHEKFLQFIEKEQMARNKTLGIFSASATFKNILLWSHYAEGHTGFCVEIDTEKFGNFVMSKQDNWQLTPKIEVIYDDKYPILDRFKSTEIELYIDPLFIKSCNWKYEDEYRFVIWPATDKAFILDDGIISAIYLGCNMAKEHRDKIIEELKAKRYKPKLHKAIKCDDRFALRFELITY